MRSVMVSRLRVFPRLKPGLGPFGTCPEGQNAGSVFQDAARLVHGPQPSPRFSAGDAAGGRSLEAIKRIGHDALRYDSERRCARSLGRRSLVTTGKPAARRTDCRQGDNSNVASATDGRAAA